MTPQSVRVLLAVASLMVLAPTPLAKGRDDSSSGRSSVEGIIRAWNPAARTFRVTDEGRTYLVRVTRATVYTAEHRAARLAAGQFWASNRSGQKVDVTPGRAPNGTTVVATHIRLDD
ncbi:hypothetical protein [Deinococcus planocerae]|uniref:hypothetical protein n=1 Tax=Deinococcus planocerae TaxID=1737569 RepID=UPI000C7E95F2|nr:hypothetical protein [Deinococcus planocerae]